MKQKLRLAYPVRPELFKSGNGSRHRTKLAQVPWQEHFFGLEATLANFATTSFVLLSKHPWPSTLPPMLLAPAEVPVEYFNDDSFLIIELSVSKHPNSDFWPRGLSSMHQQQKTDQLTFSQKLWNYLSCAFLRTRRKRRDWPFEELLLL